MTAADTLANVAMAQDPQTHPEVLASLSRSLDTEVRYAVAENPSTLPSTLVWLGEWGDFMVRMRVAANRNTPAETLRRLSDGDILLCTAVATNLSVPQTLLEELSKDIVPDVRAAAMNNPGALREWLDVGLTDPYSMVRDTARESMGRLICARFGISHANTVAVDALRDVRWWEMSADDDDVVVALALSPEPK